MLEHPPAQMKFVYKCRQCGVKEAGVMASNSNAAQLAGVLGQAIAGQIPFGQGPTMHVVHNCGNNAAGIMDLQGVEAAGIVAVNGQNKMGGLGSG